MIYSGSARLQVHSLTFSTSGLLLLEQLVPSFASVPCGSAVDSNSYFGETLRISTLLVKNTHGRDLTFILLYIYAVIPGLLNISAPKDKTVCHESAREQAASRSRCLANTAVNRVSIAPWSFGHLLKCSVSRAKKV